MKATFRIVTPAAASAAAALILTACADKPVRVPGGTFVEEPYQGETITRTQTIPSNGTDTIETENIYIENDVPVGPVDGEPQGTVSGQQGDLQIQPVEQESEAKSNAPEGSVEYKVVKGDTLWGIGMVYGVSVDRLAEINGINKNSTLKVGQVLMIPPDAKNAVGKPIPQKKTEPAKTDASSTKASSTTKTSSSSKSTAAKPVPKDGETLYVVKSGDSLSVIAQRHHVKLADLVAANNIDQKAILRIGQTLVIPAPGKATASTTTKTAGTTTTKTDTASGTKPAATAGTKTDAASGSTPASSAGTKPASTSQQKAGEGTGGIVEPFGSTSFGGSASSAQPASSGKAAPGIDPVAGVPDSDTISVHITSESTIEEVAINHDRNLEELIRLNPEFKPGQKIPAGSWIKMPLF